LRRAGWRSQLVDRRDPFLHDIVVFQKSYDEQSIELAHSLKSRGIRTVFDLCDNHFYNPRDVPKLRERAERLARMLGTVDIVSVSTEPLRAFVREKEAVLVDDALDEFAVPRSTLLFRTLRSGGPLRIAWYGNAGGADPPFGLVHLPKILPALNRLHRRHQLRLTVISNSRGAYQEAVAGAEFPTGYREWHVRSFLRTFPLADLCVVPIEQNPFTICKTANRLALSLKLGVPVIADAIPSFEPFRPYVLLNGWDENLSSYADDATRRKRDAVEGGRFVAATFTPTRVVREWTAVFERATAT
jgi:hypothetical protein